MKWSRGWDNSQMDFLNLQQFARIGPHPGSYPAPFGSDLKSILELFLQVEKKGSLFP